METLVGAALGGIARLAPEILSFFDRKNERKHAAPAGDTPGSVTNKIQVFGKDGASLGFVPVYDDIESGS